MPRAALRPAVGAGSSFAAIKEACCVSVNSAMLRVNSSSGSCADEAHRPAIKDAVCLSSAVLTPDALQAASSIPSTDSGAACRFPPLLPARSRSCFWLAPSPSSSSDDLPQRPRAPVSPQEIVNPCLALWLWVAVGSSERETTCVRRTRGLRVYQRLALVRAAPHRRLKRTKLNYARCLYRCAQRL